MPLIAAPDAPAAISINVREAAGDPILEAGIIARTSRLAPSAFGVE